MDSPETTEPPGLDTQPRPEVSVVVPVYRNRDTLVELLDRLDAALAEERREYVFVVDGSPDDSLELLQEECRRRAGLIVLELTGNFGQHAALCAGFERACGDVVLILDADLQQRPEDLPAFLAAWRAGHDFVSGYRTVRRDPLLRRIGSAALNRMVRRMLRVELRDWGCPIAAVDASIVRRVADCGEQRRFLKPLVARLARNVEELAVEGLGRGGGSSYSLVTLVGVSLDAAVSFADRPFQRLAGLGFLSFAGGVLAGALYLGLRVLGTIDDSPPVVAVTAIALFLGIQLLILGALGEFTHRIYRLVQGRPLFAVHATHAGQDAVAGATNATANAAETAADATIAATNARSDGEGVGEPS